MVQVVYVPSTFDVGLLTFDVGLSFSSFVPFLPFVPSLMAQKKWYVVRQGKQIGVFDSWDVCRPLVQGYTGAQYKSFPSKALAEHAFAQCYDAVAGHDARVLAYDFATPDGAKYIPVVPSISVDAACSGNPGIMEYRAVWTETAEEIFHAGPFADATVNMGEFLALVHILGLCAKNNWTYPIYSDSRIALGWVEKKKMQTHCVRTAANENVFSLLARADERLRTHTYTNQLLKRKTDIWGEIPADFGRK